MRIEFHRSLEGVQYIDGVAKDKRDRAELYALFVELVQDTELTLEIHEVKKLKGFKEKVYEIRKGDYRIFYIMKNNCMHILDIIKKKKNKTEKKCINLLKQRAAEV